MAISKKIVGLTMTFLGQGLMFYLACGFAFSQLRRLYNGLFLSVPARMIISHGIAGIVRVLLIGRSIINVPGLLLGLQVQGHYYDVVQKTEKLYLGDGTKFYNSSKTTEDSPITCCCRTIRLALQACSFSSSVFSPLAAATTKWTSVQVESLAL
jgi:hypothetical protein